MSTKLDWTPPKGLLPFQGQDVEKHYGPGDHPGTGTSQSEHASGRNGTSILDEVIPPPPGESLIPEGTYRMFHVSPLSNLESIRQHGLQLSRALGETYGEPNMVWFSNQTDYWKDPQGSVLVEVAIPADQIDDNMLVVGGPSGNMALPFDVPPDWVVAIHEPWHSGYHYLSDEQSRQRVVEGFYDDILEDEALVLQYGKAIERIKAEAASYTKHYGPGDHPGTGTGQSVHGRLGMERLGGVDWSEYGVRHPSVPDRAPYADWSPVMNESDAEDYFARHGLDTVVYGAHATRDPQGVLSEGFLAEEASPFNGWGDGLYMVHDGAADYYESASQYAEAGVSLRVAMGFENLLVVDAEEASLETFQAIQAGAGDVSVEFHWVGDGVVPLDHYKIITEWAEIPWDPAWDGEVDSLGGIHPSEEYPGLSKVLMEHGYDGLQINAPYEFPIEWFTGEAEYDDPDINYIRFTEDLAPAPGTGGSQTVVFDPQHAVIVGKTTFTRFKPDEQDLEETLSKVKPKPDISDAEIWRVFGPYLRRRQVQKALSPAFGKPDRRRAQLVARLKRRRKYADPVKGGTGRHKKKGGRGHFK